jgi:hypothetical protein
MNKNHFLSVKNMVKATKKDLESKIAELEQKLAKLSTQVETQTTQAEAPKPQAKPAEAPKPQAKPAESPKPAAEEKAAPPATITEGLENAYRNYPMTSFHDYRAKVTGYSPAPNRYFGRRTAPVGKTSTTDWNLQKASVTGYTQPSNQYFATRARLAYHPADKMFGGLGLKIEGVPEQAKIQQAPPTPKKISARGSLPKGF